MSRDHVHLSACSNAGVQRPRMRVAADDGVSHIHPRRIVRRGEGVQRECGHRRRAVRRDELRGGRCVQPVCAAVDVDVGVAWRRCVFPHRVEEAVPAVVLRRLVVASWWSDERSRHGCKRRCEYSCSYPSCLVTKAMRGVR